MDKSGNRSDVKKTGPAGTGTSRRAYGIFGGIINLAQANTARSNAPTSASSSPGNVNSVGSGGTSQDPQGSPSSIYTVTVTQAKDPPDCYTNPGKTYENLVSLKKVQTTEGIEKWKIRLVNMDSIHVLLWLAEVNYLAFFFSFLEIIQSLPFLLHYFKNKWLLRK